MNFWSFCEFYSGKRCFSKFSIALSSAEEALEKLNDVKPNLVLIDYFLPGVSGRQLCESIRADNNLKDLKVIFLTSAEFSKQGEKDCFERLGAKDYIKKPIDKDDLLKRVKKVILLILVNFPIHLNR